MMSPIDLPVHVVPVAVDAFASDSGSDSGAHPAVSVYVPIHKRRGISESTLPSITHSALLVPGSGSGLHSGSGSSSSACSSRSPSPSPPSSSSLMTPGTYTRSSLLLLASSPLSHSNPALDPALFDQFPFILSPNGAQIHRALQFSDAPEYTRHYYNKKGRRGRPGKVTASGSGSGSAGSGKEGKKDGESSATGTVKNGKGNKKQQMNAFFAKSRSVSKGRSGSDSDHW